MKVRTQGKFFVIGKSEQSSKDGNSTYYYATVAQGDDEAGKLRFRSKDTYDLVQKMREYELSIEYNDQYNSLVVTSAIPTKGAGNSGVNDFGGFDSSSSSSSAPAKPSGK